MENTKPKRELKFNVNYVEFIAKLKASKMSIDEKNFKAIRKLYDEVVGLRFTNLSRVAGRTKREELSEVLKEALADHKISAEEYESMSKALKPLARAKSATKAD